MVFVRRVKTGSGGIAVQLAERAGGRDKVLEHLGTAHTDADLAVSRERIHPGQGEFVFDEAPRPAVITGKRSAVLGQVLTRAYPQLGFAAPGGDALEQLVLARPVEPTFKADSPQVLDASVCCTRVGAACSGPWPAPKRTNYRAPIAAACVDHQA